MSEDTKSYNLARRNHFELHSKQIPGLVLITNSVTLCANDEYLIDIYNSFDCEGPNADIVPIFDRLCWNKSPFYFQFKVYSSLGTLIQIWHGFSLVKSVLPVKLTYEDTGVMLVRVRLSMLEPMRIERLSA